MEKKGKTVNEAFEELINEKGWHRNLNITESAAYTLASRYRAGKEVSLDKIREVLSKAGRKIVQVELWD